MPPRSCKQHPFSPSPVFYRALHIASLFATIIYTQKGKGHLPMYYSDLVKKACAIMYDAHKEDVDRGGYPYVLHPF